jgi:hypothetical protein
MYLNFKCIACENEIQSEYRYIGEWVKCPICTTVQVVPDPPLFNNSLYNGYRIEQVLVSDLLWTIYKAVGDTELPGEHVLLKIPSSFFMKYVSDFDHFADTVIRDSIFPQVEFPRLLDKCLIPGKIYFACNCIEEAMTLSDFIGARRKIDLYDSVLIIKNIAFALSKAYSKDGVTHQNLNPLTIIVNKDADVQILEMGISKYLLEDAGLLEAGFNIWDYRYMSPEFLTENKIYDSSSDIYSLGALFFLLITGKDAFSDMEPGDVLRAPLPDPRVFNSDLPDKYGMLISKMMSDMPQDRPDWNEVIKQLENLLNEEAIYQKNVKIDANKKKMTAKFDLEALRRGSFQAKGHVTHTSFVDKEVLKQLKNTPRKKRKTSETIAVPADIASEVGKYKIRKSHNNKAVLKREHWYLLGALGLTIFFVGFYLLVIYPQLKEKRLEENAAKAQGAKAVSQTQESEAQKEEPVAENKTVKAKAAPVKTKVVATGLRAELKEIDDYFIANPEDYKGTTAKYEKLIEKALAQKNFGVMDQIRDKIILVEGARDNKLKESFKELNKEIAPVLEAGEYDRAVEIVKGYKEKDEKISQENLDRIIRNIRFLELKAKARAFTKKGEYKEALDVLNNYQGEYAEALNLKIKGLSSDIEKERSKVSKIFKPVMAKITDIIIGKDVDKAHEALAQDIAAAKVEVEHDGIDNEAVINALRDIEIFEQLDDTIAKNFKKKTGKDIQVKFSDGSLMNIIVKDVTGNKIYYIPVEAGKKASNKWSSFTPDKLDLIYRFNLLKEMGFKDDFFLRGLMYANAFEIENAKQAFKDVNIDMGDSLETLLTQIDKIKRKKALESAARDQFFKILKIYAIEYNPERPEKLLVALTEKKVTAAQANKMLEMLDAFTQKYQDTNFTISNERVIEELKKFCKRSGATKVLSGRVVISSDDTAELGLSLKKALDEAGAYTVIRLKKGVYKGRGTFLIDKKGLKLIGQEGVVFENGLEIAAGSVSVSGIKIVKGGLDISSTEKVKVDNVLVMEEESYVKSSSDIYLNNCFFREISIESCKEVVMEHCSIVSGKGGDAALYLLDDSALLNNCLIYGAKYAVIFPKKGRKTKRKIENTLWFGEDGFCALKRKDSSVFDKKDVIEDHKRLKRYCNPKNNIYLPIQFVNPKENDWSLIKGAPGVGKASDGKDCGRIWPEKKLPKEL